ncbi:hypothetical protein ACK8HY_09555 [Sphingobacterium sp. NGMCC 1.201703]|uniref:8-oxoguanine DNA glycosylase OGG fold protein n=1 Tax=Sphingobacterium sp. NGMCC 1.201703 TaxID=3388657 RepID=UPI0039FC8D5A
MQRKSIFSYCDLIANLPVDEQAFDVKASNWVKQLEDHDFIKLFGDNPVITLSRRDIKETTEIDLVVLKTILWGYSSGMRGNHFFNIYKGQMESICTILRKIENPCSPEAFEEAHKELRKIKSLGLSTYSKLLYFLGVSLFGAGSALILDERIIRIFKSQKFEEFNSFNRISIENGYRYYLNYIQRIHELATQMQVKEDQIELFLFTFGNNLK